MNIALCLYGHVGIPSEASSRKSKDISNESSVATTNPVIAASGFHRALLTKYNTATFIHSWSADKQDLLNDLYAPQKCIFQEQIDFTKQLSDYGIDNPDMSKWDVSADAKTGYEYLLPSRGSVSEIQNEMQREIFRTRSRWYSTQKSIQLKELFEKETGRVFDFVVVSRLDCEFAPGFQFDFSDKDRSKMYGSFRHGRPDKEIALFDFYFMGGSKVIDKFGSLYNYCEDYCIRPTIACREHIKKFIGDENLKDYLTYGKQYRKVQ